MFFPAPTTIAKTLFAMTASGRLGADLAATLCRVAVGLCIGVGLGLPLGLLMGWKPAFRVMVDPMVAATHALPKIAIYPILMVLFGIGDGSRVALVALGAFFPMLINAMTGVRQIDPRFFEVAESYGARGIRIMTEVVWPGSLPLVLAGFRLALNGALLLGIAAELLTAREGLGGMIWMAWQTFRTEELYAALFVTGALGVAFNGLTDLLVRTLAPWRPQAGAGN
jgi:NitT/TauT family transport system permease protein